MKFYKVYPEVPASFGKETKFEQTSIPMKISNLKIQFEGWLGSDIMELSPLFFVTERLGLKLQTMNLTGIESLESLDAFKSENFNEIYPDKEIPKCQLLKVSGHAFVDDFGIESGYLIVSERIYNILHEFNLTGVEIEELPIV